MKARRFFVLNTKCTRMFDKDCGMDLTIRYLAPSGLAEFIDLSSQGFALGFRIPPFQGIVVVQLAVVVDNGFLTYPIQCCQWPHPISE